MQTALKNEQTNRIIIILGMHRSGTSALTGSLEKAGVTLGNVKQYSDDNRKGSRESPRIMALHEDIFQRNSGSWRNPEVSTEWSPIHIQRKRLRISV